MSYNLMSGNVNFVGTRQGTIENVVDTHSDQTVSGQKTITNLSGTTAHITTRLQVGGVHNTNHAVNVNGVISGSGNISGSAFYANGVLLTGGGGAVSAVANGADNRIATFSSADALNGEENLTFNGTVLDFKATSISGSGNISGSAFYGAWAGTNILGSQVQLASSKGIQDDSGLALNVAGLAVATPAGGNTVIIDQGSGAKKCTVTNLMANAPISDASALGNAGRVLLDGGVGTISTNTNLSFNGTIVSVTGQVSASSHVNVGGTLRVDNHISASVITLASAIKNQGDEDTGLSFDTNKVDLTAGASTMLTVDGNISPKETTVKNGHFKVDTSGLDLMVSSSNGFVGIGTPSPAAPLEISSSNDPQLKLTYHGANATQFTVAANGDFTINPNGATTVDSSLTVNGNTVLGDASGDITTITGFGVTIPNGLNFDSNTLYISSSNDRVGIGTVTPAAPLDVSSSATTQMRLSYDAANAVDFQVNSGGNLTIDPTGNSLTLKGDLIIKDGSEPTKTIVQIFDNQDDGLIGGYAGGSTLNFLLHGNGTSYFKNPLAVGTTTADETLSISGSFQAEGVHVRTRLKNSIFEISSSATIQSGGQALFEVKSPTNPNLFGITEGGVIASNIQPAAFNANLYVSGAAVLGTPNTAISDFNLHSGSVTFYLDEGNNKLKFRVKYVNGTLKDGEINLT